MLKALRSHKFLFHCALAGLLLNLITAWFSDGYYHPDEQFQILEFSRNFQSGEELPTWEYQARMRPWFQPALYKGLTHVFEFVGIESPVYQVKGFRILGGLLGWVCSTLFCLLALRSIKDETYLRFTVYFSYLLWIVPYIFVRPSSEGLAASLFGIAVAMWLLHDDKTKLLGLRVGALLAIAFHVRYQMGACILALFVQQIWIARRPIIEFAWPAAGFLAALAYGLWIDSLGYGSWEVTPWNYLYENLIQGKQAQFGNDPFWKPIWWGLEALPPVSTLFTIAAIVAVFKNWRSPWSFCFVSLFLLHSAFDSKAIRFLFPVIVFAPLMIGELLETIRPRRDWVKITSRVLLAFNIIGILFIAFKPARMTAPLYEYLYKTMKPGDAYLIYKNNDPFVDAGLRIHFYSRDFIEPRSFVDWNELAKLGPELQNTPVLIESRSSGSPVSQGAGIECRAVFESIPRFLTRFNYGDWLSRTRRWIVYQCQLP